MDNSFQKIVAGYRAFREKYASHETPLMQQLADEGQNPETMFVSCCDSRVDPALLLQCRPGDLFITRNIANIVPPYESDESHHGTSAALEFGICYLNVKHLIIMGHSQCGGINAFLNEDSLHQDDFISRWTELINVKKCDKKDADICSRSALITSYKNALTFPWIKERLKDGRLNIHLWFFDISSATIQTYDFATKAFKPLDQ